MPKFILDLKVEDFFLLYLTLLTIVSIIIVICTMSYFIYFDKEIITIDCPSVDIIKTFDEKNRFGFHREDEYFLLVDNKCNVIDDGSTKNYFMKYFVNNYATIINKTSKSKLHTSRDILKFAIKLLEDPLPNFKNQLKNKLLEKLNNQSKTIEDINLILTDYSNLYDVSVISINDNNLDLDEIIAIRSNTTLFVYDVLDKSGIINEKNILDSIQTESVWYTDSLFWILSIFQSTDVYKDFKRYYYKKALDEILFEKPIDYFYDNMKENIQIN